MTWWQKFPSIPRSDLVVLRKSIDQTFLDFTRTYGESIENFFAPMLKFLVWFEHLLLQTPWPIIWLTFASLCFLTSRSFKLTLSTSIALLIIGYLGMWQDSMSTIAMIVVATLLCIVIGLPIGVLMSASDRVEKIMLPILDFMQTIPSFVYLIPVVMLLGIGKVAGLLAVCIYAIPPVVRFTNHGIRIIDPSLLEACDAFGTRFMHRVFTVQIPLALPTIFAGINQTIMMALGMVVIAAMIGVRGLGLPVLRAITNQYLAMGLFNGLAIVAIAIIFDRTTQKLGKRWQTF